MRLRSWSVSLVVLMMACGKPPAGSDAAAPTTPPEATAVEPAPNDATSKASDAGAEDPMKTTNAIFPFEVHRHTLANGLKVLFIPMPSDGLSSYWTIMRTGSRDEVEAGVTGFAHFFEHMMFRGSEKYPADVYDGIVKKIGADANAYTTDDYTAFHMSLATEDLPQVIEIEADRFQNLSYPEAAFKTEAGAVYGEYRKGRTDPYDVLFEALQNTAFDVHTYKHTTIGFEADIEKMPEQYEYSKTFFKRFYRPENAVVVVSGDFDEAKTLAEIEQKYASWKPGYEKPAIPVEPEQTAARRVDVEFDGQTLPILCVTYKGPAFDPSDKDMVAGKLVGELLFGETSALYKKLVLDEQRVESLQASFDSTRDPGLWGVFAMVKDVDQIDDIEREIRVAVDELASEGVAPDQLDAVRSNMKYRFLSGLSSPAELSDAIARMVALTGDVTAIDTLYQTMDTLTSDDVKAAAKKYLTPERSTIARLRTKGVALPEAPVMAVADVGTISAAPVLMPVAADPNVSLQVWVKVGSQDDPPGKEGLAQLTAQVLSEGGTQKLAYEKILESLYPLAAGYGAQVDKEMTMFRGTSHRDNADQFAGYFIDALTRPGFAEADFERLRDNSVSYLENVLRFSSDEELGKAALYGAIFAGTPYAHVVEGTVSSLKGLTLDDVKAFCAAHYTRDNVVLGLGGGYSAELEERVKAGLGRLPAGKVEARVFVQPVVSGRKVTIVEKPGPSTAISFGAPIDVARGSKDFYALWVANSWLGEHRNSASHLYQVIREARGMNYGDYSYIESFPDGGSRSMPPQGVGRRHQIFEVWIRPVPEAQALFALRAAMHEVEQLFTNGMTQAQFDETKSFLSKYVLHFAENTSDRLGYAIDDRYYGIEDHLKTFRKVLGELTLDDVNAAIKAHLQSKDLQFAIVTEHAQDLAAKLASGAPTPMSYTVDKPADVLEADKVIEKYPLGISAGDITIIPVKEFAQ